MSVASKTVLSNLSVSLWLGSKQDLTATDEFAENKGTSRDHVKIIKQLVDKDSLKEIKKIATKAREYHVKNTMPWEDRGSRLLVVKRLTKYQQEMIKIKDKFEESRRNLLETYEENVEKAKIDLGSLWKEEDYPTKNQLENKYGIQVDITPTPVSGNIRLEGFSNGDMTKLREEMEDTIGRKFNDALMHTKTRLIDYLNKYAEILKNEDKIIKKALVNNLKELLEIANDFNIWEDTELKEAIVKAKELIIDADLLRHSTFRKTMGEKAEEILKVFQS